MFAGADKILWITFSPCLFFVKSKYLPSIVGTLSILPVKKDGLDLQNPVTLAKDKFLISEFACTELNRALKGESEFSTANHF